MESIFEGTGITALDIDQDTQASLKNQMVTFDESNLQKA